MIRSLLLSLVLISPAAAQEPTTRVTVALDWLLNTNHSGIIAAQAEGFYRDAGLEVEILPYSDTNSAALVAGGLADFGYITSLGFMSARAAGGDLTALWATMQKDPGRLVYNSDNAEITRPSDLSGKVYAGFGSAWEKALISTMIANDGGVPEWETVTLGTGAYEALATGAVDFTLEVATWEGVNGRLLGRNQSSFTYADWGIPQQQTGYIATRSVRLAADTALVRAFMKATQRGYELVANDPERAADLLLAASEFPNEALVRASFAEIVNDNYLLNDATFIGQIDPEKFTEMAKFLFDSSVLNDAAGKTLAWPGSVGDWYDQSWNENN